METTRTRTQKFYSRAVFLLYHAPGSEGPDGVAIHTAVHALVKEEPWVGSADGLCGIGVRIFGDLKETVTHVALSSLERLGARKLFGFEQYIARFGDRLVIRLKDSKVEGIKEIGVSLRHEKPLGVLPMH